MNQFKFGDHVKHPKHKGKLIFIESSEEASPLKKEWAEVLSEEAGDFVFVPLEELEPANQEAESADNFFPCKPVTENTEPELAVLKTLEEQIGATVKTLQDSGKYDARSLAVAKTQLETGLLWLNHAIQKQ